MEKLKTALITIGAIVYKGLGPAYRAIYKTADLPLFSSIEPGRIREIIPGIYSPGNPFEKLATDLIFPGALAIYFLGDPIKRGIAHFVPEKHRTYVSRVMAATIGSAMWSAVQYAGRALDIVWPHGQLAFEPSSLFVYNTVEILLAAPFVYYGIEMLNERLKSSSEKSSAVQERL